jgi:hypothetical protein
VSAIIVAFAIFGLYFLPTIIARSRGHRQENAIFLLNLLLGWTLIGWVAALVWSVIEEKPQQQAVRVLGEAEEVTKTCPQCAETIKAAAKICRFCNHEFSAERTPDPPEWTPDLSAFLAEGKLFGESGQRYTWREELAAILSEIRAVAVFALSSLRSFAALFASSPLRGFAALAFASFILIFVAAWLSGF